MRRITAGGGEKRKDRKTDGKTERQTESRIGVGIVQKDIGLVRRRCRFITGDGFRGFMFDGRQL